MDKEARTILNNAAKNLRWRRGQLGLKLWEVSAASGGLEIGGLSRLLNGQKEFYPSTLVRLSRAMSVEFEDWFLPHTEFKKRYGKRTKLPEIVALLRKNGAMREYALSA